MAYFRIDFTLSGKAETLLGVLSDIDDEVYFCVDDVARFVPKGSCTWLKCRPARELVFDPKTSGDMGMISLPDLLDALRFPRTPRSRYIVNLLEYGHVRDLPYDKPNHVITPCKSPEGIQFPTWLYIFKKDYGQYISQRKRLID